MTRRINRCKEITPPANWDSACEIQREWMTHYQAFYGARTLTVPDYYLNYMSLLGPTAWWVGAALWSVSPEGQGAFSVPQQNLADFAGVTRKSVRAAFAGHGTGTAPMDWLVERLNEPHAHDPETQMIVPNRWRWRCGLPFTPGHQEDVIKFLATHLTSDRLRKRTLTSKDVVAALRHILTMPAAEIRACLGHRHGASSSASSATQPLTMIGILSAVAMVPLSDEGDLAVMSHALWRALRPDVQITLPDLIREGWIRELGQGALWLYVAGVARTLGDRERLWVLPQGLSDLTHMSGAQRRGLIDWIGILETHGFFKPLTPLSASSEVVIRVADPEAAPLTQEQREGFEKQYGTPLPGLGAPSSAAVLVSATTPDLLQTALADARSSNGMVHQVAVDAPRVPGAVHQVTVDARMTLGEMHQVTEGAPSSQGAVHTMPKGEFPTIRHMLASSSLRATITREEEELKIHDSIRAVGWMPTADLITWCGASVLGKGREVDAFEPAVYAAWVLEQILTRNTFHNAATRMLEHGEAKDFGLRQTYSVLLPLRPWVWALILRHILAPSPATEALLAQADCLGLASDLYDDIQIRAKPGDDMARKLKVIAKSLVNAESVSLSTMADTLIARWTDDRLAQGLAELEPLAGTAAQTEVAQADEPGGPTPEDLRLSDLWDQIVENMKSDTGPDAVERWTRGTRIIRLGEGLAQVAAPNEFARDMLANRFAGATRRHLREIEGQAYAVEFGVLTPDGQWRPAVSSVDKREPAMAVGQ